jgi:energy-coupling factor transporter ATP-binding protein EcfA2
VPRSAVPAELVGRAREIEIVDELLDDIEGDGRPVLFLGEAGIGKSTLLDYAARAGRARGNTVLRADGVEFESDIGYSSLNQALLPIRRHLKALDPAHVHALGVVLGLRSGTSPTASSSRPRPCTSCGPRRPARRCSSSATTCSGPTRAARRCSSS